MIAHGLFTNLIGTPVLDFERVGDYKHVLADRLWDTNMDLHYLPISITSRRFAACCDKHQLIVGVVHAHNAIPDAERIAIAYPSYRMQFENFLGRSIRLFGSVSVLEQVLGLLRSAPYDRELEIGVLEPIPLVAQFGGYIGQKGMTRMQPSRLRRALRRRAWERDPACATPEQLQRRLVESQRDAFAARLPYVGVYSRSTGQTFCIHIEQTSADRLDFVPNAYGFSSRTKICSLPLF